MTRAVPGESNRGSPAPSHLAFATFARTSARRYAAAPLILAASVAVALVASLMPLAMRLDAETGAALYPLVERFFGNGFCQAIVALFLTSALYGALQLVGSGVDRDRLRRPAPPDGEMRASWLALVAGRPIRWRADATSLLSGRDESDLREFADRYAVEYQRQAELGLLPLRFAVWVLPLLGFIGTVVGIARSINGLEAVIVPGAGGQSAEGLLTVLGGLRFAFDTTLLGLATVIPVMLLQMILVARESEVTEESRHRVLSLSTSAAVEPATDAPRHSAEAEVRRDLSSDDPGGA